MSKQATKPGVPSSYAQDKRIVTVEYNSEPDERGRRQFTVYWWDADYHTGPQWRGQVFKDHPAKQLEYWRTTGRRVLVVQGPISIRGGGDG